MSEGQIQDYEIKILMQKYAADVDNAASILASGKKRDDKFIKNQRIVYLQMIIDFGNRNKGIPFEKLQSVPFVEKLIKQFELYYPDKGSFPRFLSEYSRGNSYILERDLL